MSSLREATLAAVATEPQFVATCALVQALRFPAAQTLRVAPFELNGLDVSERVTGGETPFEVALREAAAMEPAGALVSEVFVRTVAAHDAASDVEALIDLYAAVEWQPAGVLHHGVVQQFSCAEEQLYVVLSFLKYHLYGEGNHVTRALIQRLHTFLFMTVAAASLPFTKGGEPVPAPAGGAPGPDAPPLKDLLDACKATTDDRNNAVLNEVRKVDAAGLAGESAKLQATVRRQQMSLNRALSSIANARRQFGDESKQLGGFIALLAVCVTVFYGWMAYRPALWGAMRVPMAASALVTAGIVLAITGIAIARPVERFEQDYASGAEPFCNAAGDCEAAMEAWAAEAAKQASLSTLDATANLTKRELATRHESLAADLAAVSQRVNATDIEYRDALFRFNRVRQAKRFVVMTLAVALLLMVLVMMGVPAAVAVGLHVAAAVVILLVATLVYKGNAQRSRRNFNVFVHPGPDDV